jgi:hypothetical protein
LEGWLPVAGTTDRSEGTGTEEGWSGKVSRKFSRRLSLGLVSRRFGGQNWPWKIFTKIWPPKVLDWVAELELSR